MTTSLLELQQTLLSTERADGTSAWQAVEKAKKVQHDFLMVRETLADPNWGGMSERLAHATAMDQVAKDHGLMVEEVRGLVTGL